MQYGFNFFFIQQHLEHFTLKLCNLQFKVNGKGFYLLLYSIALRTFSLSPVDVYNISLTIVDS